MHTNRTEPSWTDLHRDERGAIGLGGAIAAVLLCASAAVTVAMVSAASGREAAQQSADAAAHTAAVANARGMNMIAAINILMSDVEAVMVPARAMGLAYAHVAATTPCPPSPCPCSIKADATRADAEFRPRLAEAEARAAQILAALHAAQLAIAENTPMLGARAAAEIARKGKGSLEAVSSTDIQSYSLTPSGCRAGLPVVDDDFGRACRRVSEHFDRIAQRIADPLLSTMGTCKSGPPALAYAASLYANPESPIVCKEAALPPCGGGPHPKKVAGRNGGGEMQSVSVVSARVRRSTTDDAPAFAQAEMFFDCGDEWSSPECNGDEHAMWSPGWSARLRRVSACGPAGDLADPRRWSEARRVFTADGSIAEEGPLQ
jgi:hypothetical protein